MKLIKTEFETLGEATAQALIELRNLCPSPDINDLPAYLNEHEIYADIRIESDGKYTICLAQETGSSSPYLKNLD